MPGDPVQLPFIMLFSGVVIFILIMFLPAFLELRRPNDSGPRRIGENAAPDRHKMQLASLERTERYEVDQAVLKKVASILSVLPNLET
jgi:hypothetical protein